MTLGEYLGALRKRWLLIVAVTILGGVIGYAYGSIQPDTYRAQSSVVVVPARGDSTSELVQGSNYVQGLVATYTVVAKSPVVLDRVIADLSLDTNARALAGQITVDSPLDTTVLQIAVTGRDPSQITQIANGVAAELAIAVEGLAPQTSTSGPAVRVELISGATEPRYPIAPNVRLLAVVGAIIGFVIGIAYAVLRQLLATRLVSRNDIADVTDLPILGEVFSTGSEVSLPTTVRESASGSAAESVRSVAAALRFANVDGDTKVIMVTSPDASEGKSSVTLALALILAEQGQKVLLIDADLRRGSIADLTGLEGVVGLTTVLVGDVTDEAAIQTWGSPPISVLTSGAVPPNPGQLLASAHLRQLLMAARNAYDLVLVDSPPVLAVSDPLWVAPAADGILIVTRYRRTKRDALARTISALDSTRTRVLGVIFNGTKKVTSNPYYIRSSAAPTQRSWIRRRNSRG